MDPLAPSPVPRRRFPWWGAPIVAVPWLWFAVRDTGTWAEAVGVAMPAFAVVSLLLVAFLAITHRWVGAAAALSALLVCSVAIVGPRIPQRTTTPSNPIHIVSDNVFRNSRWPGLAAEVMTARNADVIVSVEMGRSYWEHLQGYSETYPFSAMSNEQGIVARWPLEVLRLPNGLPPDRIMRAALDADGQRVVIYAVHLPNPQHETTLDAQRTLIDRLLEAVQAETDPVIVAGDLNLSDRSGSYRVLQNAMHDAMRTGWWANSTYRHNPWRALLLRIDYLFVPADWCAVGADSFPVPGSDHLGIEAVVGPCP